MIAYPHLQLGDRLKRSCLRTAVIGAMLALASGTLAAGTFVIDQRNDATAPTSSGLLADSSFIVGQSFMPTVGTMNAVELGIIDLDPNRYDATDLFVRIRAVTIDGTILGTSLRTIFPDQPSNKQAVITRFNFAAPVSLVPNDTYWIEFFPDPAPTSQSSFGVSTTAFNTDAYARGEGYSSTPYTGMYPVDLWFRQGTDTTAIPLPGSALLLGAGLLVAGWTARRQGA